MHPETLEEDHELGATTDSHSLISRDQDDRFAMDGRKFLSPVHLGKSFAAESEIDASYPDGMFSQSKTQVFLKKRTAGKGTPAPERTTRNQTEGVPQV